MSYGIFENLHSGAESLNERTAATRRSFATLVYQAQRDFGGYLASAEDESDLMDRVAQVEAALAEAGVEEPLEVLAALAAAGGSDDEDDEPEDAADDHDDDSDVPDFVDTDKDDDKERDEDSKKESANHLNPANPGGPQWEGAEHPGEEELNMPNGNALVAPNSPWNPDSNFSGTMVHNKNDLSHTPNMGTMDGAKAEVEKSFVNPDLAGGRHRASAGNFPVKPRTAAPMLNDSRGAAPGSTDPSISISPEAKDALNGTDDPGANAGTGAADMGNMFGGGAATPGLPGQAPAPAFPGQRPAPAVPNATLATKNAHRVLPVKPRVAK